MRLYIKQHVFSWSDRFTIKDESGSDKYFVEGELFSWGKKLHVYDQSGAEVIYIQQKVMSFMPKYHIFINGQQVAEIVKELSLFTPRYRVAGLGWNINGDFTQHEYTALYSGAPVFQISKQWFTWGDTYALQIANPNDELPALGVMLAIDCAVAQQDSD